LTDADFKKAKELAVQQEREKEAQEREKRFDESISAAPDPTALWEKASFTSGDEGKVRSSRRRGPAASVDETPPPPPLPRLSSVSSLDGTAKEYSRTLPRPVYAIANDKNSTLLKKLDELTELGLSDKDLEDAKYFVLDRAKAEDGAKGLSDDGFQSGPVVRKTSNASLRGSVELPDRLFTQVSAIVNDKELTLVKKLDRLAELGLSQTQFENAKRFVIERAKATKKEGSSGTVLSKGPQGSTGGTSPMPSPKPKPKVLPKTSARKEDTDPSETERPQQRLPDEDKSDMVASEQQQNTEGGGTPRRKGARPIGSSFRVTPKSSDLPAIKSFKQMDEDESDIASKVKSEQQKNEGGGTPRRKGTRPIASSFRVATKSSPANEK